MLRTIDRSLLVGVLGDCRGRESRKPFGSADVHGVLDRELLERQGAELPGDEAPEADERVAPEPVPLAAPATQGLDPGDHEVGRELPLDSGRGGQLDDRAGLGARTKVVEARVDSVRGGESSLDVDGHDVLFLFLCEGVDGCGGRCFVLVAVCL